MRNSKLYVCLPVLEESNNILKLLDLLSAQSYQNFELIVCVNQPDEWWLNNEKLSSCEDNQESIALLKEEIRFPVHILDNSSKGKGWQAKQKGVGWARKKAMDEAASLGSDLDLILSIDADTIYETDYFSSIIGIFSDHPEIVGLSNPYYHRLGNDNAANYAILRYEIYMRNYAINMLLIDNPYHFTALGSALATQVKTYKRVGGISPKNSGEDFYFLQKLRKYGYLHHWNSSKAYPEARFSSRVSFGTGPAMIKGNAGDWSSYPIYKSSLFQEVKKTYSLFPELFIQDQVTPMTTFLQTQLKKESPWNLLRKNSKTASQFVKACSILVDGLRILQFLKLENKFEEATQWENLRDNILYFSAVESEFSNELKKIAMSFNLNELQSLKELRDTLTNFEYYLRKLKSIP